MITERFSMLSDIEIEALKSMVNSATWGSCDMHFINFDGVENNTNTYSVFSALGCNLNHIRLYNTKMIIMSIINKIKTDNELGHLLAYIEDWWEDGKGDMVFFNLDGLHISYDELREWAKECESTIYFDELSKAMVSDSIKDLKYAINDIVLNVSHMTKPQRSELKQAIELLCKLERTYVREKMIIQLSRDNSNE